MKKCFFPLSLNEQKLAIFVFLESTPLTTGNRWSQDIFCLIYKFIADLIEGLGMSPSMKYPISTTRSSGFLLYGATS